MKPVGQVLFVVYQFEAVKLVCCLALLVLFSVSVKTVAVGTLLVLQNRLPNFDQKTCISFVPSRHTYSNTLLFRKMNISA